MRAATLLRLLLCLLLCATLCGCAHHQRSCVPKQLLVPQDTIDLNSTSDHDFNAERDALAASLAHIKGTGAEQEEATRKYNVLALSGGAATVLFQPA